MEIKTLGQLVLDYIQQLDVIFPASEYQLRALGLIFFIIKNSKGKKQIHLHKGMNM